MQKVLLVVVILALVGCGDSEEPRPLPLNRVEDEVRSFIDAYRLALEARDSTALRTMYASDGRFEWIEDGEVQYHSPDDVLSGLAALSAEATVRTEYDRLMIARVGATGARVSTGFRTQVGEGPSAFEFGGMLSYVLEKGPAGWVIIGGHSSTSRHGEG